MTPDKNTKPHDHKSQNDYSRTSPRRSFLLSCRPLTDFLCVCSLGLGVLQDYTKLKADTQAKNIAAWTPVVAEIFHGFCKFDDKAVRRPSPLCRCERVLMGNIIVRPIPSCNLPPRDGVVGPGQFTGHPGWTQGIFPPCWL